MLGEHIPTASTKPASQAGQATSSWEVTSLRTSARASWHQMDPYGSFFVSKAKGTSESTTSYTPSTCFLCSILAKHSKTISTNRIHLAKALSKPLDSPSQPPGLLGAFWSRRSPSRRREIRSSQKETPKTKASFWYGPLLGVLSPTRLGFFVFIACLKLLGC